MKKLIIILLVLTNNSIWAQEISHTAKINEIFSMLPIECKNQLNTNANTFDCVINNKQVTIKTLFNNNGKLEHIGLNIFSFDESLLFYPQVLNFVERSLLDYLLIDNNSKIKKQLKENKITLTINNNGISKLGFTSIDDILPIIQGKYDIGIKYDSLFYTVIFKQNVNELKIKFPANNNIVLGMDKKEYGEYIASILKDYKTTKTKEIDNIDTLSLNKYKDKIKVSSGLSYFKNITSSKYYTITNSKAELLFSKKYPLESFSNAFLICSVENEHIILDVDHRVYGSEVLSYSISLNDFLNFFSADFTFYFGIEETAEDIITGTLILHNEKLNFINMLYVSTTKTELFSEETNIKAKFYTNIPSDNIKNLFSEYENN